MPTIAATSGMLEDAHSAPGIVSVHATPLQHCTQLFCCCTGTLVMPFQEESLWIHLSLVHTAIETFGGGMSVLKGLCITGVQEFTAW